MVKRYSMGYSMGLNGPERLLTMLNIRDGDYVRYSDYAKLESALRECVEGFDSTTGFTDKEGDPLSRAMRKAREVLGG